MPEHFWIENSVGIGTPPLLMSMVMQDPTIQRN